VRGFKIERSLGKGFRGEYLLRAALAQAFICAASGKFTSIFISVPIGASWIVGGKEDHVVVIHNPQPEFANPAVSTEKVTREIGVFGEIGDTLNGDSAGLNDDFVAEGVERSGQRSHTLWDSAGNINANLFTQFKTEDAKFGASVYFGVSSYLNAPIAESDRERDSFITILVKV
jgi:hypothetical protein